MLPVFSPPLAMKTAFADTLSAILPSPRFPFTSTNVGAKFPEERSWLLGRKGRRDTESDHHRSTTNNRHGEGEHRPSTRGEGKPRREPSIYYVGSFLPTSGYENSICSHSDYNSPVATSATICCNICSNSPSTTSAAKCRGRSQQHGGSVTRCHLFHDERHATRPLA